MRGVRFRHDRENMKDPSIPLRRYDWRRITLCILTGVLYGLAAPDARLHFLCWVLLVPLLWAADGVPARRGLWYGWTAGFFVHLFCFYWVAGTVQRYSNLNVALSLLALVLFCVYSGLPFGLITAASLTVRSRMRVPLVAVVPPLYVGMEYLYPFIFPWNVGAGQYEVLTVIQIADLFGVYGISALIVTVNCAFFELSKSLIGHRPFPVRSISWAAALLIATILYGLARIHTVESELAQGESLTVGIVQPNVLLEERTSPLLARDIALRFTRLSEEASARGADLIVWPESAVNYVFQPNGSPSSPSGRLKDYVRELNAALVFGSFSVETDGMKNTAYLLDPEGRPVGRYDKVRLLAFGEYMPFSNLIPQLNGLIQGVGDFKPGRSIEPLCWDRTCVGLLICYEAILKDLARRMAERGARLLVNITNDAWFGDTSCPEQHLMLASLRAVENRLYLVRSANTGISAVVDPLGRIRARTRLFTEVVLVEEVRLGSVRTVYQKWGDVLPKFCTAIAVVLVACGVGARLVATPRG